MQDSFQDRMDFLGLDGMALDSLTQMRARNERHLEAALAQFQSGLAHAPPSVRFLFGRDQVAGGSGRDVGQMRAILAGQIDQAFAQTSLRQGQRQARMGLEPRWQIGAYGVIIEQMLKNMLPELAAARARPGLPFGLGGRKAATQGEAEAMASGLAALFKAVLLDIDLSVSAHIQMVTEEARHRDAAARTRVQGVAEAFGACLRQLLETRPETEWAGPVDAEFAPLRADFDALADHMKGLLERATVLQGALGEADAGALVEDVAASLGENAGRMATLAKTGRGMAQVAAQGGRELRKAGDKVKALASADGEVAGLARALDHMAFDINLLALKAASEGAALGPAGKAFAGIAQDLRQVAQDAVEAGMQARRQIETHNGRIGTVAAAVTRAIDILADIGNRADAGTALAESAAQAAREQREALARIEAIIAAVDAIIARDIATTAAAPDDYPAKAVRPLRLVEG